MPQYVPIVFGATGLTLVAALVAPAPRLSFARAANACRLLALLGLVSLSAAIALPAFDVWYPAMATVGAAFGLWFGMFWIARQPALDEPVRREADDRGEDDGPGGGGGGGGRGPDGPEEPPSPGGGLDWDAFDRERRDWERPRERELVGV